MVETGLGGQSVVIFESRRAAEMASLVERHGGVPVPAPALREVALDAGTPAALAFARGLAAGAFDVVILMTGVGARALADEVAPALDRAAFAAALSRAPLLVARGPKPAAALRELGVPGFVTVPAPNTWREVARRGRGARPARRPAGRRAGARGAERGALRGAPRGGRRGDGRPRLQVGAARGHRPAPARAPRDRRGPRGRRALHEPRAGGERVRRRRRGGGRRGGARFACARGWWPPSGRCAPRRCAPRGSRPTSSPSTRRWGTW